MQSVLLIAAVIVVALIYLYYTNRDKFEPCGECTGQQIEHARWTILNPFMVPASVDSCGTTWQPVRSNDPAVVESQPAANATNMKVTSVPDHLAYTF